MGAHLTKKTTKPYRWLRAPYQKRYGLILRPDQDCTSLPSSPNPPRESTYYFFRLGRVLQFQLLQYPCYCSVHPNSGVGQKKMYSFGGQPRESIIHFTKFQNRYATFNRCSFPNSGFDVFDTFSEIFSFYGDQSQIFPNEDDYG